MIMEIYTEKEENEVEDVESEDSDAPKFKVSPTPHPPQKKRSRRFVRLDEWSVPLHAKKANVKVSNPRTCGRQTLRNKTNARTPVAFFLHSSLTLNLLEKINTRFNSLSQAALLGLLLIPANLQQLNESSQEKLI